MRHRLLTFGSGVATAAAIVWLTQGLPSAQAQKAPAAKPAAKPATTPAAAPGAKLSTPPRTKDGHPDFSGMYDVATMTPLERPAEAGGRLVVTKEEAAAAEEYERQRQVKNDAPLAGDRGAPPVGGRTRRRSRISKCWRNSAAAWSAATTTSGWPAA